MTKQNRQTAKQYEIEERRKQVGILAARDYTEIEIAKKLGVDNSTISKDIKALKLITQQFIYDITKSDFAFYYKQGLDTVKMVLRKQWEIAEKENITVEDMNRLKVLADICDTVNTLNEYYSSAKGLHRTPMEKVYDNENFGIRPGTRIKKIREPTPEELEEEMREEAESDAEAEIEGERQWKLYEVTKQRALQRFRGNMNVNTDNYKNKNNNIDGGGNGQAIL